MIAKDIVCNTPTPYGEVPMNLIEIIRENLNPQQVMALRAEEKAKGNSVNIRRIHPALVEIEIIPASIIEIRSYKKIGHC